MLFYRKSGIIFTSIFILNLQVLLILFKLDKFEALLVEAEPVGIFDSLFIYRIKIKDLNTGKYLKEDSRREIFPPNEDTGYYIDFVRLRPRISDEMPGEKLSLNCFLL